MVLVKLYGIVKEEAGTGIINIDAKSVREVLEKLPENVKKVVERYRRYVIIVVDGEVVGIDAEKSLDENKAIEVFLVAGGG